MSFGVTMEAKNFFFDRKFVQQEVGKENAKALSRIGAFVQRRARSSMKRKGKARKRPTNRGGKAYNRWLKEITDPTASAPGSPPHTHTDDPVATLKNIWFQYDPANMSVVIGPLKLNQRSIVNGLLASGTVPQLHEFGGVQTIREKRVGRQWVPYGRRPRPGQPTRRRQARYPARPFMGPALAKEAPKFPSLWVSAAGGRAA